MHESNAQDMTSLSDAIVAVEAEIDRTRKTEVQKEIEHIQDIALDKILRSGPTGDDEDLPSFDERMQEAAEAVAAMSLEKGAAPKKKKKSKTAKRQAKNLAATATGFEDFFADVPLRPEDATLELELYSKSKSPATRLETCVQRFRANRKLDVQPWSVCKNATFCIAHLNRRKAVFDAYLSLGGVETGQKDYGGADHVNSGCLEPEERKRMTAIDFVDEDDSREVDFEFLARAFFSYRCVAAAGQVSVARAREAPDVIINFLKYVNRHDVLPEYTDQINRAIAIAEQAKSELAAAKQFSIDAPGKTNIALSVLYGGFYTRLYYEDGWRPETTTTGVGMDDAEAREIVGMQFPTLLSQEFKVLRLEKGLPVEVVRIESRNETTSILILKPWTSIPGAEEEDQVQTDLVELKVVTEKSIAEHVFEQMHFEATFYRFTDELWFFDTVTRVLPSFYVEVSTEDDEE